MINTGPVMPGDTICNCQMLFLNKAGEFVAQETLNNIENNSAEWIHLFIEGK